MNAFKAKKYLIIAALALVLSLAVIRWNTEENVPFCVNSAGCSATNTLRGDVTTTTYGYPSTYRQVEKFVPANTNETSGGYAGYKEAQIEREGLSIPKIVSNVVFWFALLHLLSRFIKHPKIKSQAVPSAPNEETPDSAQPPAASRFN
jgi:hypothetical protein